jgi:hypothetical protein
LRVETDVTKLANVIIDKNIFESFDTQATIELIAMCREDFPLTNPRREAKMDFRDEENGHSFYKYAASSIQGWRDHFEDTHICQAGDFMGNDSFFAVFDGHGGAGCAKFCKDNLVNHLN